MSSEVTEFGEGLMRVHEHSSQSLTVVPVPAFTLDGYSKANHSHEAYAASDAVQLSRLSGVLNSLQTGAKANVQRTQELAPLIRDRRYLVDASSISSKLIAEFLEQ
jgi:anti-sigma28 factor (negative regulator of flagellin synthesis)